ncbi:hypothetical protein [Ornithinimicrobium kibberense]|uniref:hypothetical protein n=1 Tax=Ornithinimicrobium kibberense TaxID=282060 RepID=UPI0036152C53
MAATVGRARPWRDGIPSLHGSRRARRPPARPRPDHPARPAPSAGGRLRRRAGVRLPRAGRP